MPKSPLFLALLAAAAPALFAADASAQPAGGQASASDIALGRDAFLKNCSLCHGGDATGGRGPDLSRGLYRRATTDARMLDIIRNGILGTGMPWTGVSEVRGNQIMSYIKSLRGPEVVLSGDPDRGREHFFGKGTCSTCHTVDGMGGRQGPDLSWIGWQRGPDFLRQSIQDPSADVEPRWWSATAITHGGAQISGILVDEDQFNVRILDTEDQLHALPKRDLESLDRGRMSTMPPMAGILTDDEIEDIVAYLAGQQGGLNR